MDKLPENIKAMIQMGRDVWGVGGSDWYFTGEVCDKPNGNINAHASTTTNYKYLTVHIEWNRTTLDACDEDSKIVAIHEVGHAAMNEIDDLVDWMLEQLPEDKASVFRDMYRDRVERFLSRASRSVVYCFLNQFKPKELEDDGLQ